MDECLVNALLNQLDEEMISHLFLNSDQEGDQRKLLGDKVHAMAQKLKLLPYTKSNQFKSGRVQPVFLNKIKPIHLLSPITFTCTTATCNPCSLLQLTRDRDIPHTKLIIGTTTYNEVPILTGKCPTCDTSYAADHEHFLDSSDNNTWKQLYTNNAQYLKVG